MRLLPHLTPIPLALRGEQTGDGTPEGVLTSHMLTCLVLQGWNPGPQDATTQEALIFAWCVLFIPAPLFSFTFWSL